MTAYPCKITREAFEALISTLVSQERVGDGPMAANMKDTYRLPDGRTVVHEWAMGGESFTIYAKP